jgi:hypothetical protein
MKQKTDARSTMVARAIAVVVSAGVGVAACGGSTIPSSSARSSATPAPAVDACLVGTWTVVAQNQNSPANDEDIAYKGGAGEVFTIDAQGRVTIDTHAAQKVVFASAGQTFTAVVAGTGRGTLSTATNGTNRVFDFEPSAADTRTTHSFGPDGVELGPARPDTAFRAVYTCAPGRLTFYKTSVDYMVDGPIVTLKSGRGTSSTGSPSPS